MLLWEGHRRAPATSQEAQGPPVPTAAGGRSLSPPHNGVPGVPPQRHSLRAQVSGGSADDRDHGSQHLLLQQHLAQQRVGALCRQREERAMLDPPARGGGRHSP